MSSQNSPHEASTTEEHLEIFPTPSSQLNRFIRRDQLKKDYGQNLEISLYATMLPSNPKILDFNNRQLAKDDKDDRGYIGLGRIRRCYANNPPIPEGANPVYTITLDEIKAGGRIRDHVTHVWTARLGSNNRKIVAKFFDPLYFRDDDKGLDPFNIVDQLVYNEWNAYQRLEVLQGSNVPRIIAAIPAPNLDAIPDTDLAATPAPDLDGLRNWHSRNVYVLLMEFIDGVVMGKIDPVTSDPKEVDRIMDMVIGVEKRVLSLGIKHEDFRVQNIILQADVEKTVNNVVLLDYEDCKLTDINIEAWDASEDAHKARVAKTRASETFWASYEQFGTSWLGLDSTEALSGGLTDADGETLS